MTDTRAAPVAPAPVPTAWPLSDRPGFLIRRAHQIHGSLFAEHCAAFRLTPLQYSLLSALADHGEADQTTLAALVALDRTTTTGALKRLEARGLIERRRSATDRRAHVCRLTAEGRALRLAIEAPARRAHQATVDMLSAEEAGQLVALLKRLVAAHDGRLAAPDML